MRVVHLVDLVAEAAGLACVYCTGRVPFPVWNGSDEGPDWIIGISSRRKIAEEEETLVKEK